MRPNFFLTLILVSALVQSCNEPDPAPSVPDPVYVDMHEVTAISATTATLSLKVKYPVTKTTDDNYMVDGKYLTKYGFFYASNPELPLRQWEWVESLLKDESGIYSFEISDLQPDTEYHVRAYVVAIPGLRAQIYAYNQSENTLEFATLP
ncbi:MAG TPA: hypothetical protein VGD40_10500 [Chryseosolibacter sp.]